MLTWKENVDLENNFIHLNGRFLKIPTVLKKVLDKYIKEQGQSK